MGLRNKLKKAAITGAALFGASKLMGAKKTAAANVNSGRGGTSSSAKARDAKNKNVIPDRGRGSSNVGAASVRTVKPKGNPKSIYVNDDGSIQKGDKLYKDKITYKNRNKSTTPEKKKTNIFGGKTKEQRAADKEERKARIKKFQEDKKNKSGSKAYLGAKKGKMMKLYSGGMAVSGKGQGIVLAGKNKKTIIC
jgi:hypothetical protein